MASTLTMRLSPMQRAFVVVSLAALGAFLASTRALGSGRDYLDYEFFFDSLSVDTNLGDFRFEPGFVYSAMVFKFILGANYAEFVFFVVFVSLLIKLFILVRQENTFFALAFYGIAFYPLLEYTQVRLAIATALGFLAIELLIADRVRLSFVTFLASCAFHYSMLFVAGVVFLVFFTLRANVLVALAGAIVMIIAARLFFVQATDIVGGINATLITSIVERQYYLTRLISAANIFMLAGAISLVFLKNELSVFEFRLIVTVICIGFVSFIVFQDILIIGHRFKELFFAQTALFFFRYRMTTYTLPLMASAGCFAAAMLFSMVRMDVIGWY